MRLVLNQPFRERIPIFIDRTQGIQAWDSDNLYPQRADQVRKNSRTTKIAVKRLAGFLAGQGFADPALASLIVNSRGETLNDILDQISQDAAQFEDSYALHFKYNLNYQIAEISVVSLLHTRFGLPDEDGIHFDIKVNNNWERNPQKNLHQYWNIYEYPVFNPDPEVVKQQIEYYGVDDYPGQVLFFTVKPGVYPEATFDAVFDQAQTQAELGIFDLNAVQQGFTATTIFKYPGTFEDEADEREFTKGLAPNKGSAGANSIIVVEDPNGVHRGQGTLVESLQLPNVDRIHENTEKTVKHAIRENFSMPAEILGMMPESGMFNKEQMNDAFIYYNDVVQTSRDRISRQFKKIMQYWKQPMQSDCIIKPKVYGTTSNNSSQAQEVPANG
jgi:hypothetical protein